MDGGATMMKDLGTPSFAQTTLSYDWGDDASSSLNDGNTGSGNSDLEHAGEATLIGADAMNMTTSTLKAAAKDAKVGLEGLSKTGTVVGAIAGGIPAGINLVDSWSNGQIGDWHDWASLGLAGLGIISEFTGLGEAYDGAVGIVIAAGTVSYDIYDAARAK